MRKQLIYTSVWIVMVRIIGTVLTFILSVALARSLGSAGYGTYTFVLSLIMLFSIPIQSGIPVLAVRETSKALAVKNYSLILGVRQWAGKLIVIYSVILCFLLVVFSFFSDDWIDSERYEIFVIGIISVPLMALILTQGAVLRGVEKVVLGVVADGLIRPSVNLMVVGAGILLGSGLGVSVSFAMMGYVAASIVACIISTIILSMIVNKVISGKKQVHVEAEKWKAALYPLTMIGGIQLLFGYIDVIILGIFKTDADVGVYKVSVQFSVLIVFGLTVLNQMLQPYFSKLYAQQDMKKLQNLVTQSSRVILILAAIPAIIFIVAGDAIINFIYGEEYIGGLVALNILILGQLVNAAFGSVGALLNMTGHEKDSMKGMIIALVFNTILNLLLIPVFGMEGAAISTALSLVLWNSILRRYVKKRLNIESCGLIRSEILKK